MLIEPAGNSILESPHGRHACTPIVPNVNSMQRMTDAIPPGDPRSPNGLRTSSNLAKEIRGRTLVQESTGQRRTPKGRAGFRDMMRDVGISCDNGRYRQSPARPAQVKGSAVSLGHRIPVVIPALAVFYGPVAVDAEKDRRR